MSKKTIFSIFLIVLGVISGLLIIYAYGMSGGNPAITLGLTWLPYLTVRMQISMFYNIYSFGG